MRVAFVAYLTRSLRFSTRPSTYVKLNIKLYLGVRLVRDLSRLTTVITFSACRQHPRVKCQNLRIYHCNVSRFFPSQVPRFSKICMMDATFGFVQQLNPDRDDGFRRGHQERPEEISP